MNKIEDYNFDKMEETSKNNETTQLGIGAVSTCLYGLYSSEHELLFVHKTREGAKKHQYEFEKVHGLGFYVDLVIVFD